MESLYTPWRAAYLAGEGDIVTGCLFCVLPDRRDEDGLIVHRGELVFAALNRYPYTNGHLMLAPFAHRGSLSAMSAAERQELIELAAISEEVLAEAYRPHGFNHGLNIGRSAGAGVADHAHLHVVPRWEGDTNFLSVIGATRTIPEELGFTRGKLAAAFARRS
ncbi:MAG TPA: HIT domain-containing protein [Thermoanaerobaculia bacterium]|jgi:ATP adenylyltransferase|nr:HIT domain-containing protein [Thermoanaerobaculia bacterium]